MNFKKQLIKKIEKLLNGKISVPEFREQYYTFYLESEPKNELDNMDLTFFDLVQEKLDWTDESPDAESKSYGWLNYAEYKEWLKNEYAKYINLKLGV